MQVLSDRYCGLTLVCKQCYALLAYDSKDIYDKKYVYCPLCKYKNEIIPIIDVEVKKDGNT